MDLFVLGTIVVVFLLLLGASLLVNKMPSGKTFEEVQKEKKQLADQMKQQSRPAKQKASSGAAGKGKEKGKGKKGGKAAASSAQSQQEQEQAEESHVEFADEPVYLSEDLPVVKKTPSSTGLNKEKAGNKKTTAAAATEPTPITTTSTASKKNKAKGHGILVNKNEQQPATKSNVTQQVAAEEKNHFEEIHPKDDIEMLKAQKDEPNKGGKPHKNAVNEMRKEKKAKNTKAAQPTTTKANIVLPAEVADIEGVEQILKANVQKLQNHAKSRSNDAVDSVRKPRAIRSDNSMQVLQRMVENTDEISVNVLIMLLAKAELSRSEIQIVIDYLLNKQSDSGAVIKSEWTEGKQDMVARLKKQLAERETQLQNEQEAAVAFQDKLKLLRLELNAEKTQNSHTAKMYILEMAQKEKEMEVLGSKVATAGAEKAALLTQMQKMQVTLVQQKNAMGSQEEHQRQVQQLQEANAAMQRELEMYKNTVQVGKVDLRNLENELDSARNEILQLHQKSFEVAEQVGRDMQVLSGQVSDLKVQAANYENVLADKKAQIEQYESEKGQTKGAEETLFRQLSDQKQSMSSLQTEVANYEKQVAEKKAAIDKYEAEREQAKSAEESLQRQLEEQKQKNNDLEVLVKTRVEEAEKELRDKFTQMLTQISVFSNLKVDNTNTNGSSSNGDSSSTAHLDAWMSRVTGDLKKKLDVYESLLSTLRQQLQETREREMLGASAKISSNSSSAKFIGEANGGGEGKANKHGNGTESGESNGNGTGVPAT